MCFRRNALLKNERNLSVANAEVSKCWLFLYINVILRCLKSAHKIVWNSEMSQHILFLHTCNMSLHYCSDVFQFNDMT